MDTESTFKPYNETLVGNESQTISATQKRNAQKYWLRILLFLFFIVPILYFLLKRTDKPKENLIPVQNAAFDDPAFRNIKNDAFLNQTPGTFINLGLQYYEKKLYHESILANEFALKLDSTNVIAYNNIGASYCLLGLWEKAIHYCNKALLINPDFQLAKNNLKWATDEYNKKILPK